MRLYVSALLLAATCTAAHAQLAPEDAPHAPDGNTYERIESIYIPSLPNAPFTATVTTGWTRDLDGGGTITIQNHRTIARDSSGRIFQERRWFMPNGDVKETPVNELDYSDPNLHELYVCRTRQRICTLHAYAISAQFSLPRPGELPGKQGNLTREDLGHNTLEGLDVIGTRETMTLDAGVVGNNLPLKITKEFWYSPQLGINLMVKRIDPRHGTQIFSVSKIQRAEPDPAIFKPPQGYLIQDMRMSTSQRGGH